MSPFCHNCIKGTSTQMVRCKEKCLWAWQEMVEGKSLSLEPIYQNFTAAPSHNWLSRQAREVLCEATSHVCRQRYGGGHGAQHALCQRVQMWGWPESKRDSSCPLHVKCAEEEWAKICFQRAPSAATCKGCSRRAPEDPSQAPTLAEIRYGCRHFSLAFCQQLSLEKETFLRERPGILPPLPPRKTQIQTQLY